MTTADLAVLDEIDGIIESTHYLHVQTAGDQLHRTWQLETRAFREKSIDPNRLTDDTRFLYKQVAGGIEDGLALVAEHDAMPIAALVATLDSASRLYRLRELRVDYDMRRQGLASAMLFQLIQNAREQDVRAVAAVATTNNHPGSQLLLKCGFEMTGLDTFASTNHDLVKETVTLNWYMALE